MALTPSKEESSCSTLSPVKFPRNTGQNRQQGDQSLTNKARLDVIIRTLLDNFEKWKIAQKSGQSLCNSIEAIKTKCLENWTPGDTLFPEDMKPLCDKLAIILTVFEDIVQNTIEALRQIKSVAKNTGSNGVVFYRTWLAKDFMQFAETILERYQSEYAVKKYVTEEIAQCQERSDLICCSSLWEYPTHVDDGVKILFKFLAEEVREK